MSAYEMEFTIHGIDIEVVMIIIKTKGSLYYY